MISKNVAIAGGVVALHIAALWAFQSGLLQRAVEIVVPVALISDFVEPPKPKVEPPPPPKQPLPAPPQKTVAKTPTLPPAPQPLAIKDPTPAPDAPTGVIAPPVPLAPITAPVAVAPAPAPPSPPRVELPSTDATYMQNPKPNYPAVSRRLGEQGKVIVRVLIGVDGLPQKAELKQSSGFERLDKSALEWVMKCRYTPGKVGGVAQAMTYDAPVNFVLN